MADDLRRVIYVFRKPDDTTTCVIAYREAGPGEWRPPLVRTPWGDRPTRENVHG